MVLERHTSLVPVALAVGMLGISVASIFVRLAHAPALAVAAYRLGLAVVFILPPTVILAGDELRGISAANLVASVVAGTALALHFWAFIASLGLTTVASAVVLQTSHPLLVACVDRIVFGEQLPRAAWLAAAVAIIGNVVIGYGDMRFSGQALRGDLVAILAAVCMAAYLLLGRRVRRELSTLPYTLLVYLAATIVLVLFSGISGTPLYPYSPEQYMWFLGLAIVPTLMGHSIFNWALRYIPTTGVSVSVLAEPVGAALLAWFILQEVPTAQQVVGGVLILTGILSFLRIINVGRRQRQELAASE